jgi:regulator of cell morphogenesis and NO signaling
VEFCCGGHRSLEQVCRDRHLDYDGLASELVEAVLSAGERGTWAKRTMSDLVEHIVESFHEPLRQELPRLRELALQLQGHGDGHRRVLTVVHYELDRFGVELPEQMAVEERELFPLLVRLDRGREAQGDRALLAYLRDAAADGYAEAGQTLRILRQITEGYTPPGTACPRLRALYRGLRELEALMQLHVHIESTDLFSRAEALMSMAGVEKTLMSIPSRRLTFAAGA